MSSLRRHLLRPSHGLWQPSWSRRKSSRSNRRSRRSRTRSRSKRSRRSRRPEDQRPQCQPHQPCERTPGSQGTATPLTSPAPWGSCSCPPHHQLCMKVSLLLMLLLLLPPLLPPPAPLLPPATICWLLFDLHLLSLRPQSSLSQRPIFTSCPFSCSGACSSSCY